MTPKTYGSTFQPPAGTFREFADEESSAIPLRTHQMQQLAGHNPARAGSGKQSRQGQPARPSTGSASARRPGNAHKRNSTATRTLQPMSISASQSMASAGRQVYKRAGIQQVNNPQAHQYAQ